MARSPGLILGILRYIKLSKEQISQNIFKVLKNKAVTPDLEIFKNNIFRVAHKIKQQYCRTPFVEVTHQSDDPSFLQGTNTFKYPGKINF